MNAVDAHPSRETLAAFDRGTLPAAEQSAVEQHVAACAVCCRALESVGDDPLVALLRRPGSTLAPGNSASEEVAELGSSALLEGMPSLPPELLDHPRYRVLELLGAGGMGAVYRAEHRLMERTVALKVINRALLDRPDAVERFRGEVKAAARLSHPNIVTAFDAEQAGDVHFL